MRNRRSPLGLKKQTVRNKVSLAETEGKRDRKMMDIACH